MAEQSPSNRPERPLQRVVYENLETTRRMRERAENSKSHEDRAADAISRFAGSMRFVYFHIAWIGLWFVINLGLISGVKPFDPYPFVMLAMVASVEAIFMSTFILISQNRANRLAERRNELNLQITLLSEHEVTRLIRLTDAIARKLEIHIEGEEEISELKEEIPHNRMIEEIEKTGT